MVHAALAWYFQFSPHGLVEKKDMMGLTPDKTHVLSEKVLKSVDITLYT